MSAGRANVRSHDVWVTVAVTALPAGWRNVYRLSDGSVTTAPCPALLLQEARAETTSWDETAPDGTTTRLSETRRNEEPYETRVIYADADMGWVEPVVTTGNYVGTAAPDEDVSDWGRR